MKRVPQSRQRIVSRSHISPHLASPRPGRISASATASSGGQNASYFQDVLDKETKRLREQCELWEKASRSNTLSEANRGNVTTAIGMANLLLTKKFKQFQSLIDQCEKDERNTGYGKTVTSDLQGFWEMMCLQIEDCNKRFAELNKRSAASGNSSNASSEVQALGQYKVKLNSEIGRLNTLSRDLRSMRNNKMDAAQRGRISACIELIQKIGKSQFKQLGNMLKNANTASDKAKFVADIQAYWDVVCRDLTEIDNQCAEIKSEFREKSESPKPFVTPTHHDNGPSYDGRASVQSRKMELRTTLTSDTRTAADVNGLQTCDSDQLEPSTDIVTDVSSITEEKGKQVFDKAQAGRAVIAHVNRPELEHTNSMKQASSGGNWKSGELVRPSDGRNREKNADKRGLQLGGGGGSSVESHSRGQQQAAIANDERSGSQEPEAVTPISNQESLLLLQDAESSQTLALSAHTGNISATRNMKYTESQANMKSQSLLAIVRPTVNHSASTARDESVTTAVQTSPHPRGEVSMAVTTTVTLAVKKDEMNRDTDEMLVTTKTMISSGQESETVQKVFTIPMPEYRSRVTATPATVSTLYDTHRSPSTEDVSWWKCSMCGHRQPKPR